METVPTLKFLEVQTKAQPRLFLHMNVSLVALSNLDHVVIEAPSIAIEASAPQYADAVDRIASMQTFALRYNSLDVDANVLQYMYSKGARESSGSWRCRTFTTLTFEFTK